jgi:hypothetical protein
VADIFLSYAREDLATASLLAEAFAGEGWTVWWDRSLAPGTTFRQEIEHQLTDARCVVVLWSKDALRSSFVLDEADDGLRRGVLVQATIDGVNPPFGFRQDQRADLSDWRSPEGHEQFVRLCKGIERRAGRPSLVSPSGSSIRRDTLSSPNANGFETIPGTSLAGTSLPAQPSTFAQPGSGSRRRPLSWWVVFALVAAAVLAFLWGDRPGDAYSGGLVGFGWAMIALAFAGRQIGVPTMRDLNWRGWSAMLHKRSTAKHDRGRPT